MAEKIRLSIIADAGAPTGFATVTHNLAGYLQDSGKYDISILGINYHGKPSEHSRRFNIYPAHLGGDFLGIGYTKEFIQETNPDVILAFQDFWNLPYYYGQIGPRAGLIAYYPVDSPNIKGSYILALAGFHSLVTYTKFGVEETIRGANEAWEHIQQRAAVQSVNVLETITTRIASGTAQGKKLPEMDVRVPVKRLMGLTKGERVYDIPHGINPSLYFPIDGATLRKDFGFDQDWFIVGNVNRNQSRKRQDLMIKAFAKFAQDKPNARLVLHCVRNDAQGWDLPQLATYYGVGTKVLFTHMLFPEGTAALLQLNQLYNTFDVQVNSGGGEGWGLTSIEGAACRVPQIVPNWSATKEIWEGAGMLTDIIEVRHEPSQVNTAQGVINVAHLTQQLNWMYEDKNKREDVAEKCYQVTRRPEYEWETIGEQFDELLSSVVGKETKPTPMALNPKGVVEVKKIMQKRKQDREKGIQND